MPPTMPAAPAGGFPQTPPRRAGIITSEHRRHAGDAVGAHDQRHRRLRHQPQLHGRSRLRRPLRPRHAGPPRPRDAAQPDRPRVAHGLLHRRAGDHRAAQAAGITGNSAAGAYAGLPAVAYWENIFPGAAGGGLTATQAITRAFMQNGPDWITALYDMDTACSPACSKFGPYAYFAEQYDSLAAISSIGRANYNGMNLTLRRRFSDGMQFDINYTLAKSEDMGSQVERGSGFGNFSNGGSTGFLINSFDPELNYGTSDFDVRHQINTNWLAELPFGQGKRFARRRRQRAQRVDRRLVGRRPAALDQRLPVQRRQLPLVLGDQLEPPGQRDARRSESAAGDRRRSRTRLTDGRARSPMPTDALTYFRRAAAGRSQALRNLFTRRRLLQHRPEPEQGVPARHCRSPAALPLGRVQRHRRGEVRRRAVDEHAGPHRLRPLQRHARDLRRAGGTLHAVRAALRVLERSGLGDPGGLPGCPDPRSHVHCPQSGRCCDHNKVNGSGEAPAAAREGAGRSMEGAAGGVFERARAKRREGLCRAHAVRSRARSLLRLTAPRRISRSRARARWAAKTPGITSCASSGPACIAPRTRSMPAAARAKSRRRCTPSCSA